MLYSAYRKTFLGMEESSDVPLKAKLINYSIEQKLKFNKIT